MSDYTAVRKIGNGEFGHIFLIEDENKTRKIAKVCNNKGIRCLETEIAVLKTLSHSNIIAFHEEFFGDIDGIPRYYVPHFFIGEYLDGADCEVLLKIAGPLSKHDVKFFTLDITNALIYLEKVGVVHRDIKPANIMKSSEGFKLIDFGLATTNHIENEKKNRKRPLYGTPYYSSPELTQGESYTSSTDLWAFGVSLYRVVTRRFPFKAENLVQMYDALKKLEYAPTEEPYQSIFSKIFIPDVSQRIDAKTINEFARTSFPIS